MAASFFVARYYEVLDPGFDAADAAADHDLCAAIATGKMGLHPDAWGNHDPLTLPPPRFRKPWRPPVGVRPGERQAMPVDWSRPTPRPKPDFVTTRPPAYPVSDYTTGELQLTCDECRKVRFGRTLPYGEHGRMAAVAMIRFWGHNAGWTCIVGRDRCPKCSQLAPPQAKGNGAGPHQGNEQHP